MEDTAQPTSSKNKLMLMFALFILLGIGTSIWISWYQHKDNSASQKIEEDVHVNVVSPTHLPLRIKDAVFNAEVSDTKVLQELGLSGRESIAENEAMLFSFNKDDLYYFWMKDMNFPIDILWLDKDKQIVHIVSNVDPDSYPKTFVSETPARYVLEIKSGVANKNKIKVGDIAKFEIMK